jgi:hypothetical protein
VHTDSQSDQLNKSIQAKAFTTGQDIFFRQGAYEPNSRGGQELIAHELTHVVQQNGGAVQRSQETPKIQNQIPTKTGLPDHFKSGMENLSGYSISEGMQISNSTGRNCTTVQRAWEKHKGEDEHKWTESLDGLTWFYQGDVMKYQITEAEEASTKEWLAFYRTYEGQEKSYAEWHRLFNGSNQGKKAYLEAARGAAYHTTGNYKSRNAVISTLTKYDLLEACLADGWHIGSGNKQTVLESFRKTYAAMGASSSNYDADDIEASFYNILDVSKPIIRGFKTLGEGDKEIEGQQVNRGDSVGVLEAMGLMGTLSGLKDGETHQQSLSGKFLGATSTAKGNDPGRNQYAKNATVVWILTIGSNHHGFDLKKISGEGYDGEAEITFPAGSEYNITSVTKHEAEEHAGARPTNCNLAQYTIIGGIR